MDPNLFAYAQLLGMGGSQPFFQVPQTFPTMGGSQPSTQEIDPDIETVPETQPEPVVEGSKRGKRSHKKKDPTAPRRKVSYLAWTKDEEYALARAWLDISKDPNVGKGFKKYISFFYIIRSFFVFFNDITLYFL
ncbi:hypothetical protein HanRHA438_Chr08g0345471 [Helianthus annuus]|nr:hypothetical protein HanRHA438_Chr08g0345471 [Helianthus annuus]